jgi:hypothetical protein
MRLIYLKKGDTNKHFAVVNFLIYSLEDNSVKIFFKHPIGGLTPLVSVMEQTVMNITPVLFYRSLTG